MCAWPDVDGNLTAGSLENCRKLAIGREEGVGVAVIEPDESGPERLLLFPRQPDHVVVLEVGGVIVGAGGGISTSEPERGGMSAGSAEATRIMDRQIKRAGASHRDAADGDAAGIGTTAGESGRDRHHCGRVRPGSPPG